MKSQKTLTSDESITVQVVTSFIAFLKPHSHPGVTNAPPIQQNGFTALKFGFKRFNTFKKHNIF